MIIKGYVTNRVNIRRQPSSSGAVVGVISNNQTFEGNEIVKDSSGNNWCKIYSVSGVRVVEPSFIALYIQSVKYSVQDEKASPSTSVSSDIPIRIRVIEEFAEGEKTKTRTTIWENPKVSQ